MGRAEGRSPSALFFLSPFPKGGLRGIGPRDEAEVGTAHPTDWIPACAGMTGLVVEKGRHRGLPLRPVLLNQVAVCPANLAPMAKAFSQSTGNTVR